MRWREYLLAVLLIWQGVQLLYTGALGIPGIIMIPMNDPFMPHPNQAAPSNPPTVASNNQPAPVPAKPEPAPVEQTPPKEAAKPAALPSDLPSASELEGWVKSAAQEFVGGVDSQGNILYRFDVWLDAPADKKERIASVDYMYDAPSATPAAQASSDRASGFRVKFGGLTCAQQVSMTVTFNNGDKREARVNGCQILDRGN